MSDRPGLSRRGLFTFGLSRLVNEIDEEPPLPAVIPPPAPADAAEQVDRLRAAWGRSDGMGLWADASSLLLDAAAMGPGERVLDAGAGDGNVALLAAEYGAEVTACDFSPDLVARGRLRTEAAGAQVRWLEADLAGLPFPDASFDHVLSAFAPMFCLDARGAMSEMFRVAAPGGTVAFTAWTAAGIVGRMLRLAGRHDPPPAGVPAPLTWGREERLRQDLERHASAADIELVSLTLGFATRSEAVERLLRAFGPLAAAPQGAGLRAEAAAIVDELAGSQTSPVRLKARYLVVVAERRAP